MADISKLKLGSTIYSLKDQVARTAISNLETAVSSAMVIKGVVSSAAEITNLTNYKKGWTYKISSSFYFEGELVESGDMIICISDFNSLYKASDWNVVQNNIDVMQGASNNSDGSRGLVPAPTSSDNNHFLRGDGTWQAVPETTWSSISSLI